MPLLQLPPTIRLARLEDLPDTPENRARIGVADNALIVPGYRLRENPTNELPFRFYAEINVDNDQLWSVFQALASHLPDEACLIYHHVDEGITYSPYTESAELLKVLGGYQTELTQDGFLCTGLLHHANGYLEEVYISAMKYLQYWGMDEDFFRCTMALFSLPETSDLAFLDEFPRVTRPLSRYKPECRDPWEVLGQLLRRFGQEKQ